MKEDEKLWAAETRPAIASPAIRLHEIDGIRGWAALSVLLFHVFWEVFGKLVPEIRHPALRFVLDGHLAVFIFFVLSADALAWPFLSTGNAELLDRTVLKRYFRLALPIFFSGLMAYALMRAGWIHNAQAAPLVKSDATWFAISLTFEPNLFSLLNFSFGRALLGDIAKNYNAFLWPMPIELFGSFLVFAFCYSIVRRAAGLHIVLATAVITFFITEHFCLFFAGLSFALLRQNGHFDKQRKGRFGKIAAPLLLLLCAAMDTLDYALNLRLNFTLPLVFRFHALLAVSIVYCIFCNSSLVCFFSNGISRWLGKVSFPLYLVHFSIICSLTSYLIIVARRTGELQLTQVLMIGTITVATAFAAAAAFERLERTTLRWVDRWVRKVLA